MLTAYTDYPLTELGDIAGEIAPIRQVEPLSYDGDKYVRVRCEGKTFGFKAGYLYMRPGRCGEVKCFDVRKLPVDAS